MFGIFLDGQVPFAVTVERPWLNNQNSISCIPFGTYICKRVVSPKFGITFEVTNVPSRSEILIHKGNVDLDSHGCIVVGEYFGTLNNTNAVIASGPAFNEFLRRTTGLDEFQLTIEQH